MLMAWNQGASLLTDLLNHDTVAIHQSIDTTCQTGFGLAVMYAVKWVLLDASSRQTSSFLARL